MMKTLQILTALCALLTATISQAAEYKIKYSSNYLMPAYVNFSENGSSYSIQAKINVPLYNIQFNSSGKINNKQLQMLDYQDIRNGKLYSRARINNNQVEYGKVKNGLTSKEIDMPLYDLFTMAFQLSYYDKLPINFITTNGKKLYPMNNVFVKKFEQDIKQGNQIIKQITYSFKTGDKDILVQKYQGEHFPRYLKYSRDGDDYELTFSEFVQ